MQSPAKISPGPAKLSILCYSPAKPCQAKYRDSSQGESMVYTNADHVGIILKSINGEVYLLDATSEIVQSYIGSVCNQMEAAARYSVAQILPKDGVQKAILSKNK